MIDKSAAEIAALDGLHLQWHLCLFHMLQDWERALKQRNGVSGKDNRLRILRDIKALAKYQNETLFKHNEERFQESIRPYPEIYQYYQKCWKNISSHWAGYGRQDIADLCSDTNNLQEVQFRVLKYCFCLKRKCTRVEEVLKLYTLDFLPHYMMQRDKFILGFKEHSKGHSVDRYNHEVKYLSTTKGAIAIISPEVGHCQVCSVSEEDVSYTSVVGDLSCECEDNNFHICKHVEAASSLCSRTATMRVEATQSILANNLLYEVDKEKGIYKCPTLAAVWSNKSCRREFTIVVLDLWCSCHDFAQYQVCCHLLATKEAPIVSPEWQLWVKEHLAADALAVFHLPDSSLTLNAQRNMSLGASQVLEIDASEEIEAIKNSTKTATHSQTRHSEMQKEAIRMLNEACSVVKCLDDRTLEPKLEEIRGLTNSLKRGVPHFQRIHIGERSHWNRKQADKTLKVSLFFLSLLR